MCREAAKPQKRCWRHQTPGEAEPSGAPWASSWAEKAPQVDTWMGMSMDGAEEASSIFQRGGIPRRTRSAPGHGPSFMQKTGCGHLHPFSISRLQNPPVPPEKLPVQSLAHAHSCIFCFKGCIPPPRMISQLKPIFLSLYLFPPT